MKRRPEYKGNVCRMNTTKATAIKGTKRTTKSQQTHLPSGGEPTASSLSLLLAILTLAPLFCGVRPGGEGRACEDRGEGEGDRAAGAERGGDRGEARVGEDNAPLPFAPFACPFELTARSKGKPGDGIAPGTSCVVVVCVVFVVVVVPDGLASCIVICI